MTLANSGNEPPFFNNRVILVADKKPIDTIVFGCLCSPNPWENGSLFKNLELSVGRYHFVALDGIDFSIHFDIGTGLSDKDKKFAVIGSLAKADLKRVVILVCSDCSTYENLRPANIIHKMLDKRVKEVRLGVEKLRRLDELNWSNRELQFDAFIIEKQEVSGHYLFPVSLVESSQAAVH